MSILSQDVRFDPFVPYNTRKVQNQDFIPISNESLDFFAANPDIVTLLSVHVGRRSPLNSVHCIGCPPPLLRHASSELFSPADLPCLVVMSLPSQC